MTGVLKRVVLGVALALLLSPAEGASQRTDLAAAERLVEEGRFHDARAAVLAWWEGDPAGRTRDEQQLAVWLRALLTIDPAIAELDFRRLVVEFPGGRFADESLLRLAQLAEAREDPGSARQFLEILIRDYPQSPHRVEARSRMARLPARTAPQPVAEVPAAEVRVEQPPPVTIAPAEPPPSEVALPEPVPETLAPDAQHPFAIQLGAFSTAERARTLAGQLRDTGHEVRVVQVEGSGLFRVRIGAFETRDEAESLARTIRGLGFEAVISSDRLREMELQ